WPRPIGRSSPPPPPAIDAPVASLRAPSHPARQRGEVGGGKAGLVHVIHGAGEHCRRYDEVASRLSALGYFAFAHDHVGHGQSEGPRMQVSDFQVFVRDTLQHFDLICKRYPDLPIFLLGHSMGGAISILAASERSDKVAGVVLIGPLIEGNPDIVSPFKIFLMKIFKYLLPSLTLASIGPTLVTRNKAEVELFESDPLVHHAGLSVSFLSTLMDAVARIEALLPDVTWPFLLLHGDEDQLCFVGGSKAFHERARSADKTLHIYEGAYHALHKEIPECAGTVLEEIEAWIVARTPA
uniref:Monoglyceride lipase n=1 Tax=Petromyzon marinus TaxID=7757 RepID=S4RI80_PETMA